MNLYSVYDPRFPSPFRPLVRRVYPHLTEAPDGVGDDSREQAFRDLRAHTERVKELQRAEFAAHLERK